jgi:leader peptidase (prepilin peptidase)/N-methyltransferase
MEKIIFIFLFGMVWGSFLNVVIYRLPAGLSLAYPPSTCPKCKKRIKPYDNIPILSYLLLGGKCRFCKAGIPFSYFMVEVLTPACFVLVFIHSGQTLSLHFFASCLFTSVLITLGFIDFYHQILPNEITWPAFALALIYAFFRKDMTFLQASLGAAAGAGFLLLVYGAYWLLRKKEGLGIGDVFMMLLIGAFLGWAQAFFTLILASFGGAIAGVFLLLVRKKGMQAALPYGTFLAPAAFIALIWGERIIRAYLSLFTR